MSFFKNLKDMCQTKSSVKNKGSCQCHNYKRMSLIGDTQRQLLYAVLILELLTSKFYTNAK